MTDPGNGWYVILRESDAALSCLYREDDGRWRIEPRYSCRVPHGWRSGPRVDDLLRTFAWAEIARHLLTPAQLALIEAELAREPEKNVNA